MVNHRTCGLLMPVSSLPSDEGIGTLGRGTYKFLDYMAQSSQRIWQVLPLTPTNYGDSPYQSCSAGALNYYFIDLRLLRQQNLLTEEEIASADLGDDPRRVDYGKQFRNKIALLKLAYSRFNREAPSFRAFVEKGDYADFSLFMALKEKFGHAAWTDWDEPYRTYREDVAQRFLHEHESEVEFWQFTQFVCLQQWENVRAYAHARGISVMGDIPLYIAYDSVEMWKYGDEIFRVDKRRVPAAVAGCPPDAFSEAGQLWGNPVYDWERMRGDGYKWWNERIEANFRLFDILRIDHFRGFDRYYAVPYGAPDARVGTWEDGPKEALFAGKLAKKIVAEDLGVIDDGVRRLMRNVGYPGMKILEFAFDGDPRNEHKPSNCTENYVVYTGTHDNMPLRQYIEDLPGKDFCRFLVDLKAECNALGVRARLGDACDLTRTVIRLAYMSRADTVIIPMWDVLALGGDSRINLPATVSPKNWSWRFLRTDFNESAKKFLKTLALRSNRVYNMNK